MPHLKDKVSRAREKNHFQQSQVKLEACDSGPTTLPEKVIVKQEVPVNLKSETIVKNEHSPKSKSSSSKREFQSNKNIVKNYARAMINFSLSATAIPYLNRILKNEIKEVNLNDFRMYMQEQKEDITSIKNLRELLLVRWEEDDTVSTFKRVFKEICVVFVKFFSVNWIYSSKINDKVTHVKYRFKILRRIRNPELFTYLENFSKTR